VGRGRSVCALVLAAALAGACGGGHRAATDAANVDGGDATGIDGAAQDAGDAPPLSDAGDVSDASDGHPFPGCARLCGTGVPPPTPRRTPPVSRPAC
jgi:hypothetical protein